LRLLPAGPGARPKELRFHSILKVDCVERTGKYVYFTIVTTDRKEIDFRCAGESCWNAAITLALIDKLLDYLCIYFDDFCRHIASYVLIFCFCTSGVPNKPLIRSIFYPRVRCAFLGRGGGPQSPGCGRSAGQGRAGLE
ncbi:PREDICTED: pleckstrin homology-like domain family A member 2, partial [Myotis brandtii]|uniref:pleckstrin homology-like domain family A member 2 n=1 Tax=Myotis brandtii TaxID=109478 RepID=UPI0007042A9F